jgi:hypothetical protein
VYEQVGVDRGEPGALPVVEVGRQPAAHRRRQRDDLVVEMQPTVANIGEQQIAQLLDADGVEGERAGERGGCWGIGVEVLPQLVQLDLGGSREVR